jgi:general nucleoside transport system permease protein
MIRILNFSIDKRATSNIYLELGAIVLALIMSLAISAGLIALYGADVGESFTELFRGAFGNKQAVMETLVQATPLLFMGLATLIAFRGQFWNIGLEGQFFAGMLATTWICINFGNQFPGYATIVMAIGASLAAGAAWGFIPGYLKVRFGANEIIVTIMLNYIIALITSYLLGGPWQATDTFFLETDRFNIVTNLPTFFGSRLHLGFFISIFTAVVVYFILWKTPLGFEIRAIGENPTASKYAGIKRSWILILTMMISGAIAGLAGSGELLGIHHRLRLDISPGYGFTGILIGLLGGLNPFGVIPAALLFGALVNGATSMQILTGVPVALVQSIQGIVLICFLTAQIMTKFSVRRIEPC